MECRNNINSELIYELIDETIRNKDRGLTVFGLRALESPNTAFS